MKIDEVILSLEEIKRQHGNIEVTCTGSFIQDGKDVFETTVENFFVRPEDEEIQFKRVRLFL